MKWYHWALLGVLTFITCFALGLMLGASADMHFEGR